MKVSKLKIQNYVGITELSMAPSDINILKGPNGVAKTSVLEALGTAFKNEKRRTEVVKHGESEATIFVETDSGLDIDRRIRTDKADYLKLHSPESGIKSTEKELRKFISGDVFNPLEFLGYKESKQADIILGTIPMDHTEKDFAEWFGNDRITHGLNMQKHTLMILKDVESKAYERRQDVNREARHYEAQIAGIEQELPEKYNGKDWEKVSLQALYDAVNEANKTNAYIDNGVAAQSHHEVKIAAIQTDHDFKRETTSTGFASKRTWIKKEIEDFKHEIALIEERIKSKEAELERVDVSEIRDLEAIEESRKSAIETENKLMEQWNDYLGKTERVDVEPLQEKALHAEKMKSHLREWYKIDELNKLIASKKDLSALLTAAIEKARSLPSELLKQYKLPIEGVSIDDQGRIRINGTLLDGLSEGEKLDVALRIAEYQMGELRILCIDEFQKLDKANQQKIIDFCQEHDVQAFITMADDTPGGELVIEKQNY